MTKINKIDVFNGDADGICALIQYRLANPAKSKLITGVKRDISLLEIGISETWRSDNCFRYLITKNGVSMYKTAAINEKN